MKFKVTINAVVNELDPSHKRITEMGIEKAVEKFKKYLSDDVESIDVAIKEISDESSKN